MRFLRTHIARVLVTVLIWAGMGLYLTQTAHARTSSNAFASWLSSILKDTESGEVRSQLNQLRDSDVGLYRMLERASEIVSRHNEEVILPFNRTDRSTDLIFHLLLVEWNQYQTGNDMGKASIPHTLKQIVAPQSDKNISAGESPLPAIRIALRQCSSLVTDLRNALTSCHTVPMSGGTAIGAP